MEMKELLEAPKLPGFERSAALEHYETLCDRAVGLEANEDSNTAMNYIVSFATFVIGVVDTLTNNDRELSAKLLGDELYGRLKDIVVQADYDEEECRASITYFVQFGNPEIFDELCKVLNIPNRLDICRKHLVTMKTRQFENLNKLVEKNHMRILPFRCEFTHQQVLEQFQFCKEDGKLLKVFIPKDAEADLSKIRDSEVVALIPPAYDEMDTVWYNKSIAYWSKLMNIKLREYVHKDNIDVSLYKEIMLEDLIPEVKSTPYGQGKTLGMLGALTIFVHPLKRLLTSTIGFPQIDSKISVYFIFPLSVSETRQPSLWSS